MGILTITEMPGQPWTTQLRTPYTTGRPRSISFKIPFRGYLFLAAKSYPNICKIRFGFNSTHLQQTSITYQTQCLVQGIARGIMDLQTIRDQEKVRHTLRQIREKHQPIIDLNWAIVKSIFPRRAQISYEVFRVVATIQLLLCYGRLDLLPKSKGAFIKTGYRPTLCLKWASWAFPTLLEPKHSHTKTLNDLFFRTEFHLASCVGHKVSN